MTQTPDTLEVGDLDTFVKLLHGWHSNKVALLEHMMNIPEGTEFTYNDGAPMTLTGDIRDGFIVGLTVALIELGQLPFAAEVEDASQH